MYRPFSDKLYWKTMAWILLPNLGALILFGFFAHAHKFGHWPY
jgi:hypothetical protein